MDNTCSSTHNQPTNLDLFILNNLSTPLISIASNFLAHLNTEYPKDKEPYKKAIMVLQKLIQLFRGDLNVAQEIYLTDFDLLIDIRKEIADKQFPSKEAIACHEQYADNLHTLLDGFRTWLITYQSNNDN